MIPIFRATYITINKKLITVPAKRIAEKDRLLSTPTNTPVLDSRYLYHSNYNSKVIAKENIEKKIFRGSQSSTPGSARKVIMGLERGLNRVRCVLTPKRRVKNESTDPDQPNILSGKVHT